MPQRSARAPAAAPSAWCVSGGQAGATILGRQGRGVTVCGGVRWSAYVVMPAVRPPPLSRRAGWDGEQDAGDGDN
ncbi:hypothetical protein SAMN05421870_108286 [Streptomyces qinglanensis]|uniref:Uncharacterized protein n=1 Tax=Streptomyces qinglanensis TaxID=943816 RepID=A0A1H9UJR7_9ACTN|nr:hypothetical protein SAMN05421870_108286 [Streptomyces qinglanensis]